MYAVRIDSGGFFVSDLAPAQDYTGEPLTAPAWERNTFFRPRWNGASWEEGAEQAEVDSKQATAAAAAERAWRNGELERLDKRINDADDRGQLERAGALRAYRVALRDMPAQSADARDWKRPADPGA